jgi:hypothetical protein
MIDNPYALVKTALEVASETGETNSDIDKIIAAAEKWWPRIEPYVKGYLAARTNGGTPPVNMMQPAPGPAQETAPVHLPPTRPPVDAGALLADGLNFLKNNVPPETPTSELLAMIEEHKPLIIQQLYLRINPA